MSSMVRLLQGRYHILQARNGVEALAVLEKEEVNLIVSDIMMPEMDGIELCRRIKEKFETCHIPVILLTAKITDGGSGNGGMNRGQTVISANHSACLFY